MEVLVNRHVVKPGDRLSMKFIRSSGERVDIVLIGNLSTSYPEMSVVKPSDSPADVDYTVPLDADAGVYFLAAMGSGRLLAYTEFRVVKTYKLSQLS